MLTGKTVFETRVIKDYVVSWARDLTFKEIYEQYGWNMNVTVTFGGTY